MPQQLTEREWCAIYELANDQLAAIADVPQDPCTGWDGQLLESIRDKSDAAFAEGRNLAYEALRAVGLPTGLAGVLVSKDE